MFPAGRIASKLTKVSSFANALTTVVQMMCRTNAILGLKTIKKPVFGLKVCVNPVDDSDQPRQTDFKTLTVLKRICSFMKLYF